MIYRLFFILVDDESLFVFFVFFWLSLYFEKWMNGWYMDSETTFMSVSPGWQLLVICTSESCCGFSLRGCSGFFYFCFFIFLSRCSGTNCITAPFQTHLDVTSQPARRHLVLFNLMFFFFSFSTPTRTALRFQQPEFITSGKLEKRLFEAFLFF